MDRSRGGVEVKSLWKGGYVGCNILKGRICGKEEEGRNIFGV